MEYYLNNFETPLMSVLPILRSSPCFVVGIPVALAILLLSTSTPKALLGENDVPGMLKIFIGCDVLCKSIFLWRNVSSFIFLYIREKESFIIRRDKNLLLLHDFS